MRIPSLEGRQSQHHGHQVGPLQPAVFGRHQPPDELLQPAHDRLGLHGRTCLGDLQILARLNVTHLPDETVVVVVHAARGDNEGDQ